MTADGGQGGRGGRGLVPLGAFYLFFFATIGFQLPWFPPYLQSIGFGSALIGAALAMGSISRVFLPPLWGLLADRIGRARLILAGGSLLGGACLALVGRTTVPAAVLGLLFLGGFFLVPLVPLAETLTMAALGNRRERYGQVRLWGSLGFIVTAWGFGGLVPRVGLAPVPFLAGACLALAGLVALAAPCPPRAAAPREPRGTESAAPFPWRRFGPLLAAAALGQGSHGAYYAFFTLELEARGVSPALAGFLWALGVLAEVLLMAASPRFFRRLGAVTAFRLALLAGLARWLLYAAEPPLALVAVGQLLHALTFGLLHLASIQLVDRWSPGGRKATGQGLLSALAYGLGIGGGLFLAGIGRDALGDTGLYLAAAGLAALALVASAGLGGNHDETKAGVP